MRSTGRNCAVLLAAAIALFATVPVRAADPAPAPPPPEEDGAAAPANSWLCDGGCAARTSASHTEPLRGPVEVAWTRELGKELRGDPLVYNSRVFVETVNATGGHSLVALRLTDGAVLADLRVGSSPLRACVAQGVVVACGDKDAVHGYRLGAGKFTRVWGARAGAPVESMATVAGELYVRTGSSLLRFDVGGSDQPVWKRDGLSLAGPVVVRGSQVFVVSMSGDNSIDTFDRRTGASSRGGRVGSIRMSAGDPAETPLFTVTLEGAYVVAPGGFATQGGGYAPCAAFTRSGQGAGAFLVDGGLGFQLAPPVEVPGGWIAPMSAPGGDGATASEVFLRTQADGAGYVIAKAQQRTDWLGGWRFASYAGGVVYHPGGAFDAATRALLWTMPVAPGGRIVPARDRVLFVRGKSVVAVGPRGAAAAAAATWGKGLPADPADATVALLDGTSLVGSVRKDGDGLLLAGPPPRKFPLDQVMLVQDASGAVLHAASADTLDDALSAIDRGRRIAALEPLLTEATASRDAVQIGRLVTALAGLGGRDELIRRADARTRDLRNTSKEQADAAIAAKVDAAFARGAASSAAGEFLKRLPADAPRDLVVWLCRRAFVVAPKDEEATNRVRALLPPDLAPKGDFDARAWVDVAELSARLAIEVVRTPPPGTENLTRAQRAVAVQSVTWRPDVIGLKSKELLVITPLKRPDAVARCMAFGTLACETMQSWCAGGKRVRDTREPLTLLIYENEAEYQAACRGHAVRIGEDMSWTSGHYSPGEALCRLYLPEDDVQMRRGLEVFVHELCHHWVDERCPLFGDVDRHSGKDTAGNWIVEGFADLVENLRFDPSRWTWALDPFAEPLEVVAGAPRDQLIPWARLYDMTYDEFIRLSLEWDVPIAPQRSLIRSGKDSQMHLFYMQASATCRYLYEADGGRLRPKLFEYLADRYSGHPKPIPEAFGMSADELGKKVIAFCEATLRSGK